MLQIRQLPLPAAGAAGSWYLKTCGMVHQKHDILHYCHLDWRMSFKKGARISTRLVHNPQWIAAAVRTQMLLHTPHIDSHRSGLFWQQWENHLAEETYVHTHMRNIILSWRRYFEFAIPQSWSSGFWQYLNHASKTTCVACVGCLFPTLIVFIALIGMIARPLRVKAVLGESPWLYTLSPFHEPNVDPLRSRDDCSNY